MYTTTHALRLKKYIHTKSSYDHSAFLRCKSRLSNLTKKLRAEYENNIVRRYVNSKLKTRERIPTFKNMDGTFSVSPLEKAEALNQYFGSIFVDENLNGIPISTVSSKHLNSIRFTKEMILEKLQVLNPSKSKGPDGWHPYFLRELSEELSESLSMLFQQYLKERVVPTDWLRVCITAIHKNGAKGILSNYRPISITSALCKLFESIIKVFIIEHLARNKLFAEEQHGFVPNRNCITNLLTAIEDWSALIEEGKAFDLIYTDFSKAFDSVPHGRLINKLKALRITGDVLGWIKSFFTKSSWTDVWDPRISLGSHK